MYEVKAPAEVVRDVKMAARLNQFVLTSHCRERMSDRGVTGKDLACAMGSCGTATYQSDEGTWLLSGGTDLDELALSFAVAFDDRVVVVTVF